MLALIAVPSVVAIASKVRGDGHGLWTYAERWVVTYEKESCAGQAHETDSLLDVKA